MTSLQKVSTVACATMFLASLAYARPARDSYSGEHESSVGLALLESSMLAAQGPQSQAGWVIITEFMKDPAFVTDTKGEWIEVYNAAPWRVNLEGCTLTDDSGSHHVISTGGAGLRFMPGRYLVLGNNADINTNGGVHVDYAYSGFGLGNAGDQIILSRPNGAVLDRVDYDDGVLWPDTGGRSISVKLAARDQFLNDAGTNWCNSSSPLPAAGTDTGTPGADNDACP
jgi:hypothetical protein